MADSAARAAEAVRTARLVRQPGKRAKLTSYAGMQAASQALAASSFRTPSSGAYHWRIDL